MTSFGIKPIHGNIETDRLVEEAQNQATVFRNFLVSEDFWKKTRI